MLLVRFPKSPTIFERALEVHIFVRVVVARQ
ncbi:hypothetical protein [Citrobacter phage Tr1]|nr:hypothetical protein [Citrobacter phage Tr1]